MVSQRTLELELERDGTQAILEALGEAVLVTDVHGRVQYMNSAASRLTGYSRDEIVGRPCPDRVIGLGQEDTLPDGLCMQIQVPGRAGERWSGEVVCRRKDGTLYDAAVAVAAVGDPLDTDSIAGFVTVQRDITPIKDAERQKDRLISNVSHELRTPLSVLTLISGNLDLLYDSLSDDRRRQMIRDIREHIQVLSGVIDAVLALSRIDSAQVSEERERLNLVQLAVEEAEKQRPLAQVKSQTIVVTGETELPVWGNEDQVRQVIRNLLNNAIKYTPEEGQIRCQGLRCGQPALHDQRVANSTQASHASTAGTAHRIAEPARPALASGDWSHGEQSGQWAALQVIDTGIGIGAEELPHLFERFYRVKTEASIPGTGLGLSIASELIALHGGQLTVASTPGEGSVFTIFLPLLQEEP